MSPSIIAQNLFTLAVGMDAQQAVYGVRVSATTTAGADTIYSYNLQRVCYRPATLDELTLASAALADQYGVWTILQPDLDAATPVDDTVQQMPAPTPLPTYTLTINGQLWTIERVNPMTMNQSFECLCVLGR